MPLQNIQNHANSYGFCCIITFNAALDMLSFFLGIREGNVITFGIFRYTRIIIDEAVQMLGNLKKHFYSTPTSQKQDKMLEKNKMLFSKFVLCRFGLG